MVSRFVYTACKIRKRKGPANINEGFYSNRPVVCLSVSDSEEMKKRMYSCIMVVMSCVCLFVRLCKTQR